MSKDKESKDKDPQGNVPDKCSVALLLIDVINGMEFEGAEQLLAHALPMAEQIAALKQRASALGIPAIYVNDNFGRWQSNFPKLVRQCLEDGVPGKPIVERLRPAEDDYFVLKPKHSGFYQTPLAMLLDYLGAKTLILTGVAGNICVFFTADDAYMRHFKLVVPRDCIASNTNEDNRYALRQMERVMDADTRPACEVDLQRLLREATQEPQTGIA